jgi:cobalt/nickel transport system permease protein
VNRWHDRAIENGFLAGGMLLLAVILPPFPCSMLVLVTSIGAASFGARVPIRVMMRAMAGPCLFVIIGLLPMMVTVRYTENIGPVIEIHPAEIFAAVSVGLRALGATASLILLGVTTPVSIQIEMLRRLHAPSALLDLMALTYRLPFLFDGVLVRMIAAQSGRLGYRTLHTGFRSGALAVAGLFSRIPARARAMERGLAARGYNGDLVTLNTLSKPDPRRLAGIAMLHGFIVLMEPAWKIISHG